MEDVNIDSERITAIAPADCANAYAPIKSIAANSRDRSMRIVLSYVRGNAPSMCLSLLDACSNIADVRTILYGNRAIYHGPVRQVHFKISSLGRNTIGDGGNLTEVGADLSRSGRGSVAQDVKERFPIHGTRKSAANYGRFFPLFRPNRRCGIFAPDVEISCAASAVQSRS